MTSITYWHDGEQAPRVVVAGALARLGAMSAIGVYLVTLTVTPLAIVLAVGSAVAYAAEVRWRVPSDEARTAEGNALWFGAAAISWTISWPLLWLVGVQEFGSLSADTLWTVALGWLLGPIMWTAVPHLRRRSGMSWSEFRRRLPRAVILMETNILAMFGVWHLVSVLH